MTLRKPSTKQPKPVSRYTVTEPDIEDLEIKRTKTMRNAKELEKKEKTHGMIAQAFEKFFPFYI